MKNQALGPARGALAAIVSVAALMGCGGGDMLVPEASAQGQISAQDQAAVNRAMQANADALNRVKGERAARQSAQ